MRGLAKQLPHKPALLKPPGINPQRTPAVRVMATASASAAGDTSHPSCWARDLALIYRPSLTNSWLSYSLADPSKAFISQFRLEGSQQGPLVGKTLAVKDLFDVSVPCVCCVVVAAVDMSECCCCCYSCWSCEASVSSTGCPYPVDADLRTDCWSQNRVWQPDMAGDTRGGNNNSSTCSSTAGSRYDAP